MLPVPDPAEKVLDGQRGVYSQNGLVKEVIR
jgi:hypothetical protein